jgi:hypothetical protein
MKAYILTTNETVRRIFRTTSEIPGVEVEISEKEFNQARKNQNDFDRIQDALFEVETRELRSKRKSEIISLIEDLNYELELIEKDGTK